jgi:alkanesulfonate monooxygenase SsuD/methylene tetrahydromethanopterin reductase-like flavin-dependent oxidoreductase (luciferase family)
MKLGYFFTMYNFEHEPDKVILDRALEQALVAEDAGFHAIWMGEHHFGGEGWDVHPNPLMTGAYFAAKTTTIRIGLAAAIAPEWHPLRLAEDVATLDNLSGGRVECGLGRGITSRELSNLNLLNPDRRKDEARNWGIFLETVEILKKAWTEDPFTFDGEYYKFPMAGVRDSYAEYYPRNPDWRSEDGEYIGMCIVPKPLQKPYPPLWNTVDKTPGFAVAAEYGLKPITWLRSKLAMVEAFEVYRDAEPAVEALYRDYIGGLRGRDIHAEPGETISDEDLAKPWFDFLFERGHLFVGTPESVAEQIQELEETASPETMLLYTWLPGLKHEEIMASLGLFCEQVLPRIGQGEAAVR